MSEEVALATINQRELHPANDGVEPTKWITESKDIIIIMPNIVSDGKIKIFQQVKIPWN